MKTERIEFDTQRSLNEISRALNSFNCSFENLARPFISVGGQGPAIAVLMSGRPSFKDSFRHPGAATAIWYVEVVVTDLVNKRHVELTASGGHFDFRFSKDYMHKIASALS